MNPKAARIIAVTGLAVALALGLLWISGGLAGLQGWAAERQREAQTMIAAALRRLRAGEPGATMALLAVCFGYGFVHAVGPGHGKFLIGGYGFGTRVPMARLALLSVLASLAQALSAVVLVWGGITLLDLTRDNLTQLTEKRMADISAVMIGLVGLWLAARGVRQVLRMRPSHDHDHAHDHDHTADCGCGHSHGPSVEEVAATHSLRDAIILIAGIAVRPCTGALFLLILTWRLGIFPTGIAGAMAMGLGTASVTLAVAALSVWAREGSLSLIPQNGRAAAWGLWLPGVMQLAAGVLIAVVATGMLI